MMRALHATAFLGSAHLRLKGSLAVCGNLFVSGSKAVGGDVGSPFDNNTVRRSSEDVEQLDRALSPGEIAVERTVDVEAAPDLKRAAFMDEDAIAESTASIGVAVQQDAPCENLFDVIHSSAPVVVCTNTVAEAGGVTSAPGEGETEEAP